VRKLGQRALGEAATGGHDERAYNSDRNP